MSAVDSTSNEKALKPYWTGSLKGVSSQLFVPTKTVLRDLDSSLSSTLCNQGVGKSWFSTNQVHHPTKNSQKIFFKSCTSSPAECTASGDTETVSRKIRIYPDRAQRSLIRKWFGAARYVYNKTVEYLKEPGTKASFFAIKGDLLSDLPDWCSEVPYQIKSIAVRDACQAVKAAKRKYQATGKFNQVRFKSRKSPKQSCYIPKSSVKGSGIYPRIAGNLKWSELLPDDICDCRLVLENGRYFLSVPHMRHDHQAENQGRIVALDPGVRTFITFFSEDCHGKVGDKALSRIQRLCHHLDSLLSRMTKVGHKARYNMRKAANRIRWKIKDLVDELHWKVINYLTSNFDVILLPTFETGKMARKAMRKIGRKSVRSMLTLSHYRFKERLRQKCVALGKVLVDCCEAYTSKTVSWTGEVIYNLGGRKEIKSKITGDVMDRDINAARGILLRALVDSPLEFYAPCMAIDCCEQSVAK